MKPWDKVYKGEELDSPQLRVLLDSFVPEDLNRFSLSSVQEEALDVLTLFEITDEELEVMTSEQFGRYTGKFHFSGLFDFDIDRVRRDIRRSKEILNNEIAKFRLEYNLVSRYCRFFEVSRLSNVILYKSIRSTGIEDDNQNNTLVRESCDEAFEETLSDVHDFFNIINREKRGYVAANIRPGAAKAGLEIFSPPKPNESANWIDSSTKELCFWIGQQDQRAERLNLTKPQFGEGSDNGFGPLCEF